MNPIRFTKMHGIGNDYIYLDCINSIPERLEELAVEMSDRHTGVGGDGIILICPSEVADFRMVIFNADGSEAKMCGNASRCVGKYVYEKGLTSSTEISLETLSGIKYLSLRVKDGRVTSVTVDMGEPVFEASLVPVTLGDAGRVTAAHLMVDNTDVNITAVSMGNPHGVFFVEDLDGAQVHRLGPLLERHPMWPDRANIEFARIDSPADITMRVWERGSGETMACGTGACATAVAAAVTGQTGRKVTVHLLGGDLVIDWRENGHVYMTGPAEEVFEGVYWRR